MARDEMTQAPAFAPSLSADERVTTFLRGVYGWMGLGLADHGADRAAHRGVPRFHRRDCHQSRDFLGLTDRPQLGIVLFLSARVDRMAASTASLLFIGYSALTGITLSLSCWPTRASRSRRRSW